MKNFIKPATLFAILLFNISCAQTIPIAKNVSDLNKFEIFKREFVGKPLKFLLSKMNLDIKSVLPVPNNNVNEVNRIIFRFVSLDDYRQTEFKNPKERPTSITVVFNQNWNFNGYKCNISNPECSIWTKKDEESLADLVVYDIYVLGKN